jgi:light-regulated signal transduction histidine kinase (bacteriophytochrome)
LDEPSLRLFQKRTAQWLAGEKPDENIEYRVLVKDGSECYAFLNVTFNRDEAGRPLGATVIAYDITERRRANLLLKERSEAIQEYSRRLEQSNRELENFAFIVSHDLQEPLRKIEKFGGLLREGTGPAVGETERLYIERMQDAAGRMRQMIDDLLALSRVSSTGNAFAQVDLNRVVQAVQEDLESRLKPVDGKISCEVLPVIEADPTQMHQLFQNLIGNAIKFRQPGVPPLIRISACLDSEQTITLLVADNGIGFDEKYVDQIFEPFKRLHGRSEYEGNGIGLAICKRIAERHHGAITAHSHPGLGATFSVTLPLKQN